MTHPPSHDPAHVPRPPGCIRETYQQAQSLLPCVNMVGWSHFDRARRRGLAPHQHVGAWEICYIHKGHVDWWVDQALHEIGPGQVFFTRPDELHGAQDEVMHPCELYWVQVTFDPRHALPGLSRPQAMALWRDLSALEHRQFPAGAGVPALFERLLAEHRGSSPHAVVSAQAALVLLLVEVVRWGQAHQKQAHHRQSRLTSRIRHVLGWIDAHLGEPFTMADLASQAGLGASQFRARFQEEVGQPPVEHVTRLRIKQAKTWLASRPDLPITTLAHRLGYSSSQYFATTFKRRVGMTPGEYRASHPRNTPRNTPRNSSRIASA